MNHSHCDILECYLRANKTHSITWISTSSGGEMVYCNACGWIWLNALHISFLSQYLWHYRIHFCSNLKLCWLKYWFTQSGFQKWEMTVVAFVLIFGAVDMFQTRFLQITALSSPCMVCLSWSVCSCPLLQHASGWRRLVEAATPCCFPVCDSSCAKYCSGGLATTWTACSLFCTSTAQTPQTSRRQSDKMRLPIFVFYLTSPVCICFLSF